MHRSLFCITALLFVRPFVHQAFPFLFHPPQRYSYIMATTATTTSPDANKVSTTTYARPFIDIILTTTISQTTLNGYVGFDTITQQIEKKLLKRGFQFNVMVVGNVNCFLFVAMACLAHPFVLSLSLSWTFGHPGQTGLGKSTLVNTIFASHLIDSKGRLEAAEPPRQTTEIEQVSHCKYWFFHHVPELHSSSPMLLLLLSKCQ